MRRIWRPFKTSGASRGPWLVGLMTLALLIAAQAVFEQSDGTSASFLARAGNAGNAYDTAALYAPAGLTAAPRGQDVTLTWATPGRNGSEYRVGAQPVGAATACPAATPATPVGTVPATPAASTFVDSNRAMPAGTPASAGRLPQGSYVCYQVQTGYGSWTSQRDNPVAAVQVGFVTSRLELRDSGATIGLVDQGDSFVLSFNQPVDPGRGVPSAESHSVCANRSINTVFLATTTMAGACSSLPEQEPVAIGTLAGACGASADCVTGSGDGRWRASYTWSPDGCSTACTTLTITLGPPITTGGVSTGLAPGTYTFTPTTDTSKLLSASGGVHVCDTNAGGGSCLPSFTHVVSTTPTPVPTLAATASPTATAVAVTATATATGEAVPTTTPTAGASTTPSAALQPVATSTAPEASPSSQPAATAIATALPTGTPAATPTVTVATATTVSSTPTPPPTTTSATPTPTTPPTAAPTATASGSPGS